LIELLIVVAIIGILVAIAAVLGTKVLSGGKSRAAEDTIRVLDAALTDFEAATNAPAPSMCEVRVPQSKNVYQYAILDARPDNAGYDRVKDPAVPSIVRFTAMVNQATSAQSVLKQINAKYVRQVRISSQTEPELNGLEVVDPWNNLIRAVHPSFDGGYGAFSANGAGPSTPAGRDSFRQVNEQRGGSLVTTAYRRSFRPYTNVGAVDPAWVGDADEGMCPNKRMYFYSCGADGNPGSRADNAYSTRPTFPQETAKY
jgi:type II secretory pathway pseudopilin PulG